MNNNVPNYGYYPLKIKLAFIIALFSFLLSILPARPVHAIRLTFVKHIFDIKHNFQQPSDLSVSNSGHIYIVDGVNSSIKVFDQSGKFAFSFGQKGSLNGQFEYPLGIDIDDSGRVYIADSGNHRVQIFSSTGAFAGQIRIPSGDGILSDPTDVAVNGSGNRCYVVDNNNHYILVYSLPDMKLIGTYGTAGTDKLEFRYPFLMTLDREEYLYVVDVINTRVQVISPEGRFVSYVGGWGVEKGEFFRPKGVAIDRSGRVFVSDSYLGVIQVFKKNGEFFSVIGDPENRSVKKFKTPAGIFIDNNNRLYVVEMFAEKVSVYSLEEDSE